MVDLSCSSGYVQKLADASANLQLALFSFGFIIQSYSIEYGNFLILGLWESTIKYPQATPTF